MKLTPEQRRALLQALLDAFPTQDDLELMAFSFLDENPANFGGRYVAPTVIIQRMIVWAESRDSVNQLIAAARASNPHNALVAALSERLAPASARSGGFEVLINKLNPAMDVKVLLARLSALEGQVGRVEYDAQPKPVALGTAFLVGSDLVLTNDHVLAEFAKRNVPLSKGRVRFDYALLPDGVSLSAGRAVPFAAAAVVDRSPVSPGDVIAEPMRDADPGHLDYALVRLAESVGEQPRGDPATAGPKRGWVQHVAPLPGVDEPLWIMQHPLGDPVKLAFSEKAISMINNNATRFRHRVNTRPGSSGSPCFNYNLELVGMHHYGDEKIATPYNQAVPMTTIAQRISTNGQTIPIS